MSQRRRKVGIVGFGKIGQTIVDNVLHNDALSSIFELCFIWNRTFETLRQAAIVMNLDASLLLEDLDTFESRQADIIVEVAHPDVYLAYGVRFLQSADVLVGSPTAFANNDVFQTMTTLANAATGQPHGLYLAAGALWGSSDVARMGDQGTITKVSITMRKPPHSMKLVSPLKEIVDAFVLDDTKDECVVYTGPVRPLCPLAPNNVNTMACLAIASGANIGFDGVVGTLIADKTIHAHVIRVEVVGQSIGTRVDPFVVRVERYNPCDLGVPTAMATYMSFVGSLKRMAMPIGGGLHFV